jgi:hypothetical protein
MVNKKFLLGMLVMALTFGMTVVGCEKESTEDTIPSPPTGLRGTVVSNGVQLTWNPVSNAAEYWVGYKESSDNVYQREYGIRTASHTVTGLQNAASYDFQVAVKNTDGYASEYSAPITVTTGGPQTANVSVSMETRCFKYTNSILQTTTYTYTVAIRLTLSTGALWSDQLNFNTVKSWIAMTGTPNVSSWSGSASASGHSLDGHILWLEFSNASSNDDVSISGLTATIDTTKFEEMKNNTNVSNSITSGVPLSASSSLWTKNF